MALFTALLDSNVLYSMPVTDIALELAASGLFRARWSAAIHDEWMRVVEANLPHLTREQIERRRNRMDVAVPQALVTGYEALVTGYEALISSITLPDPGDRHVLAAAIVGRADVIVTFNLKDFPALTLAPP